MVEHEANESNGEIQGITDFKDIAHALRPSEESYGGAANNTNHTIFNDVEVIPQDRAVQLAHSFRLHTLGEMASQVVHQMRQPLCAIITNAHACLNMLQTNPNNTSELIEAVEAIITQVERASEVVERIREFAQNHKPRYSRINIRHTIDNSLQMVWAKTYSQTTDIHWTLSTEISDGDETLFALADPILIQQVVINLLGNAVESMAETEARDAKLTIRARNSGEDTIDISIADTGCGVSAELKEKIFTPFFSTKREGLGIGLSIARSIIQLHNGRLWLERNDGKGTVFHFTLPKA